VRGVQSGGPEAHVYDPETEAANNHAVFRGTEANEKIPEHVKEKRYELDGETILILPFPGTAPQAPPCKHDPA
jgi:hypothetical protein